MLALKVSDIDSARMLPRVEQSMGRKDRNAMLSPLLLDILREWQCIGRPAGWQFPDKNPVSPLTTRQVIDARSYLAFSRASLLQRALYTFESRLRGKQRDR